MKLRTRVFLNFVLLVGLFGLLGALLGGRVIRTTVVVEAQRNVEAQLRSAWSVVNGRLQEMELLLLLLGTGRRVADVYGQGDPAVLAPEFETVRQQAELDFVGLTDRTGRVILRSRVPHATGDTLENDPFVSAALRGEARSGFTVLSPQRLQREGGRLVEQAFVVFEKTPRQRQRAKESERAGMALMAAAPARNQFGEVIGAIYAGVLLNRNNDLVDKIRRIVFRDEQYEGRHLGTVTIFQWDVRIATNVRKENGNRALGTRVSEEVYEQVLENDRSWYDRAFVVNTDYLSAYDSIHNPQDETIGILYVGVLAKKYDDIIRELWGYYGGLSALVALIVLGVGVLFAQRLTGALHRLAEAAKKATLGDLDQNVEEPPTRDEVHDLTEAFNTMMRSLRDREARLQRANSELAETNRELQELNAHYLDLLGFVSHELKNTLGIIYTAARSLDAGLVGELSEPQKKLVHRISRSIDTAVTMTRHYLDLAHIEQGELRVDEQPIDLVVDVVEPVLAEVEQAAEEREVTIENGLPDRLPSRGDRSLLRVVYKNLLDNALKYGREGGTIRLLCQRQNGTYRLEVWNEGHGLPPDKLDRLFRKFARFDEKDRAARRGTGLGLFITREIIRNHNGDIHAESQEGDWISFIFTLPAEPEANTTQR